jgi:hypothetical protein
MTSLLLGFLGGLVASTLFHVILGEIIKRKIQKRRQAMSKMVDSFQDEIIRDLEAMGLMKPEKPSAHA